MLQTKIVGKIITHILCINFFFRKLCLLWYYYYYYYRYSAFGPVCAETRAQSGDWYGYGRLRPGQVLRGRLPLLSPVCDIMYTNFVEPGNLQMTIRRIRIACWIPKATDTHLECLTLNYFSTATVVVRTRINPLKPTGHVMHQKFNIQQLYALPTLHLCVLYLSENKQRLVPLTA